MVLVDHTSCLKIVLIVINSLIWVFGVAILAVSAWMVLDPTLGNFLENIDMTYLQSAARIGIAIGISNIIVGLIGYCGATKENMLLLKIFVGIGILLTVLESAAIGIIWTSLNRKDTENRITSLIEKQIKKRLANDASKHFVDLMQKSLRCCGTKGPKEYYEPPSSCKDPDNGSTYESGCVGNMMLYLKIRASIFGGIATGILLLQVSGIIIAGCLICIYMLPNSCPPSPVIS